LKALPTVNSNCSIYEISYYNKRSRKLEALSTVNFNCHKDQPEDGPKIRPKHVAGIII